MNDRVALWLPPHTFLALSAYRQESGLSDDLEELAAAAIGEWVIEARKRAQARASTAERGYQWKGLFLPSATRLRMYYDGKFYYAEVVGDDIIFQGNSVSPARMANAIADGTRNAWRDLWLLFPGESAWKLAGVRRRQARQLATALASAPLASPAPQLAAPQLATPASPADALLRRLAVLLEQSLQARQPQYRRRSDMLDDGDCALH